MGREIDDELGLKPKTTIRYVVIAYTTCPKCNGTGIAAKLLGINHQLDCFDCNGKGEVASEVNLVDVLNEMGVLYGKFISQSELNEVKSGGVKIVPFNLKTGTPPP